MSKKIEHPLDFELPLVQLEAELEELRDTVASGEIGKKDDYARLEQRVAKLRDDIYGKLSSYQR
ncbi:MAG: hypothetical protein KDD62_08430, partial [Bdellovibrionales bacterium]|nr:hypothetical protein [Bdellovibrionales bacterium]